jgi:hypothetical protein
VVSFAPKKKVSITLDYAEITRESSSAPHHLKKNFKTTYKNPSILGFNNVAEHYIAESSFCFSGFIK